MSNVNTVNSVKLHTPPRYHNFFLSLCLLAASGCVSADEVAPPTFKEALYSAIELKDLQDKALPNASPAIEYVINTETGEIRDVIILNVANACTAPPCPEAEGNLGTFTITEIPAAFTIAGGSTSISFPIPDALGAATAPDHSLIELTISNTADGDRIQYDVIVRYRGMFVSELVANSGSIANMLPAAAGNGCFCRTERNSCVERRNAEH